jgi:hypothetical protein
MRFRSFSALFLLQDVAVSSASYFDRMLVPPLNSPASDSMRSLLIVMAGVGAPALRFNRLGLSELDRKQSFFASLPSLAQIHQLAIYMYTRSHPSIFQS